MKNVSASVALSIDTYRKANEVAARQGLTLSAIIRLAILYLLERSPDELAALCARECRRPMAVELEAHHE